MKHFSVFCVYMNVLTYFKDVFDGASPSWGRSRFIKSHTTIHINEYS